MSHKPGGRLGIHDGGRHSHMSSSIQYGPKEGGVGVLHHQREMLRMQQRLRLKQQQQRLPYCHAGAMNI